MLGMAAVAGTIAHVSRALSLLGITFSRARNAHAQCRGRGYLQALCACPELVAGLLASQPAVMEGALTTFLSHLHLPHVGGRAQQERQCAQRLGDRRRQQQGAPDARRAHGGHRARERPLRVCCVSFIDPV